MGIVRSLLQKVAPEHYAKYEANLRHYERVKAATLGYFQVTVSDSELVGLGLKSTKKTSDKRQSWCVQDTSDPLPELTAKRRRALWNLAGNETRSVAELLALHSRAEAKMIATAPPERQQELTNYLNQIRPNLSFDPEQFNSGTPVYHEGNGPEFFAPNPKLAAYHGLTLLPAAEQKEYQSVHLPKDQEQSQSVQIDQSAQPIELLDSTPAALVIPQSTPTNPTLEGTLDMPVPGAAPAISGPTPTPQTVAKVATVSTTPVTPSASGASASGITVKPSSNDKNKSAQTSHLEQIANKLISASTRKKLDQQSVAVTKLPDNDVAAQKPSLELSFSAISQSSAGQESDDSIGTTDDLDLSSSEDEGAAVAQIAKVKPPPPPVAPKPVRAPKSAVAQPCAPSVAPAPVVANQKVVPPNPLRSTIVQDVVIPDEPATTIDLQTALMNFTSAYLANKKSPETRAQTANLRLMGRQNILHYHAQKNVFVHADAVELLKTVESTAAVTWDYRIGLALANTDSERAYHLANLEVAEESYRTAAKLAYGPYLQIPEQLDFIHSYNSAIGLRHETNPATLSAQGIEKAEKAYRKLDKACVLYLNTVIASGDRELLSKLRARERYENPILQVRLATLEETEKRYQSQGMGPFDKEYVKIRRSISFLHAQLRFWTIAKSLLDERGVSHNLL